MTNRPKENDMKDLDMSDVERDAETMMQKELEEWGEQVDGADLYTVIAILIDWDDSLTLESQVIRDLIDATQSNPSKSTYALRQMMDLDNAIREL